MLSGSASASAARSGRGAQVDSAQIHGRLGERARDDDRGAEVRVAGVDGNRLGQLDRVVKAVVAAIAHWDEHGPERIAHNRAEPELVEMLGGLDANLTGNPPPLGAKCDGCTTSISPRV